MLGKTVSHYRITEKLGQGGMGEVYRAEDTNLSRQVAIKVLPDEFAHDAERLARFEREAKLLASLNHPNIASIYGLEQADGKPFLVLELVEGESLQCRMARSPFDATATAALVAQVARAVDHLHRQNLVHRDLKPSNILLDAAGQLLVPLQQGPDRRLDLLFDQEKYRDPYYIEKRTNTTVVAIGCSKPQYSM